MYAVIRIRGTVNISPNISKTLEHLNLRRINNMSLWKDEPQMLRMIKTVEDYVAFGEINDETLKEVISKKGKPIDNTQKFDLKKAVEEIKKGKTLNQAGVTNCFRMSPPRGGFERNGVKKSFKMGGAAGNRKEKINELIMRMMQ